MMEMPILAPLPLKPVDRSLESSLWGRLRLLLSQPVREWVLVEDWSCFGFTIKAGFVCDLDSVPRIPFIYAYFKGRARASALLHDYLYRMQLCDRKTADDLFLEAMYDEGLVKDAANAIYMGVRAFGWRPYKKHMERKSNGETTT